MARQAFGRHRSRYGLEGDFLLLEIGVSEERRHLVGSFD